jgi:hypothetical protein
MPAPSSSEVQQIIGDAVNWVIPRLRKAPANSGVNDPNKQAASMYPSCPLTAKVPPGYSMSGAQGDCDYVRHLGNEFAWYVTYPPYVIVNESMELYLAERSYDRCGMWIKIGNWADGQPSLWLFYWRLYYSVGWVWHGLYYYGKPSGDSRSYPIKVYFEDQEVISDHRTQPEGYVLSKWTWRETGGNNSNKYFVRTENIPASKLLVGYWDYTKLRNFHEPLWPRVEGYTPYPPFAGNDDFDIHSPLFWRGSYLPDDYMFQNPGTNSMYHDCEVENKGCPQGWPYDINRGPSSAGWGFSHRSKVCQWPSAYTWVLRQDGLGLLSQAIHVYLKYADHNRQYSSPWPWGVPGGPPDPLTPKTLAEWAWNKWYRPGVGMTMYQVPIIGGDQRASSLRTNQMLVLATLLGYQGTAGGGPDPVWAARADEIADILRQVQVGHSPQPSNGVLTQEQGAILRPQYGGAQLYVWDQIGSLGLVGFGWLRDFINDMFDLPDDDLDYIISTIETTATYAQAFRVYLYHKYGIQHGDWSTIPAFTWPW